jgi:hypothetical protein
MQHMTHVIYPTLIARELSRAASFVLIPLSGEEWRA